MGISWTKNNNTIKHPKDVERIKEYLEYNGKITHWGDTSVEQDIEELYYMFSKWLYDIPWVTVSDDEIYAFSLWLEDQQKEN